MSRLRLIGKLRQPYSKLENAPQPSDDILALDEALDQRSEKTEGVIAEKYKSIESDQTLRSCEANQIGKDSRARAALNK